MRTSRSSSSLLCESVPHGVFDTIHEEAVRVQQESIESTDNPLNADMHLLIVQATRNAHSYPGLVFPVLSTISTLKLILERDGSLLASGAVNHGQLENDKQSFQSTRIFLLQMLCFVSSMANLTVVDSTSN